MRLWNGFFLAQVGASWSAAKKLKAGFKDRLGCVIQEQNYIAVKKQRVHN